MFKLSLSSISISAIALSALIMPGVFGCSDDNYITTPATIEYGAPPEEVNIDRVYADYMANKSAADHMYKGKRFLFTGIRVEEVESYFLNPRAIENYIMYGSVKFRARYAEYLDGYKEGFVVDIVGEVQSLSFGDILIIKDCWFSVVEGDIDVQPPPAY